MLPTILLITIVSSCKKYPEGGNTWRTYGFYGNFTVEYVDSTGYDKTALCKTITGNKVVVDGVSDRSLDFSFSYEGSNNLFYGYFPDDGYFNDKRTFSVSLYPEGLTKSTLFQAKYSWQIMRLKRGDL